MATEKANGAAPKAEGGALEARMRAVEDGCTRIRDETHAHDWAIVIVDDAAAIQLAGPDRVRLLVVSLRELADSLEKDGPAPYMSPMPRNQGQE